MDLKNYYESWLHVNDCVSLSIKDGRWDTNTYKGMIINVSNQLITVLFTDGDIHNYSHWNNKLIRLTNVHESLAVGEKIIKILTKVENQNTKIEEQKSKINASLSKLLQ